MLFDYLKIKNILNDPKLVHYEDIYYLGNDKQSNALLCNKSLAIEILKNPHFEVFAYQEKLKNRSSASLGNIQAVSDHFSKSPLLMNGQNHIEARKNVLKFYNQINDDIDQWIHQFTRVFIESIDHDNIDIDPIITIDNYIQLVFKKIFAQNLGCLIEDIPPLPGGILKYLIPQYETVQEFNKNLNNLDHFIKHKLVELGRSPNEAWLLITIPIQGYETMLGSLVYGLVNDTNQSWDEDELFRRSSAVSLLTRKALRDIEIQGYTFYANQFVFISPFLTNAKSNFESEKSLEFGLGKKLCPGKKMSLRIAKEFLTCFRENAHLRLRLTDYNVVFERMSMLTPKLK